MATRLVVGIAGGSGSGKTTLAARVQARLPAGSCARLSHDAYYRCLADMPLEDRARWNFDHPDSLESELLVRHLDVLRQGEPVHVPVYDFGTHTRRRGGVRLEPAPVVVVDGVLLLAVEDLRSRLDLRVFVETSAEERLRRRVLRDTRRRGRTRESVLDQWRSTVHPMYERFVAPSRNHAHLVVEHGGFDESAVDRIAGRIRSALEAGP